MRLTSTSKNTCKRVYNMTTVVEYLGVRKRAGEIGIEVECEGQHLATPALYWHVVGDGSLRAHENNAPVEYVLKSPVKRKEVTKVLNHLHKTWIDHKAIIPPSPRTSVHIHVNVQELEFKNVITFYCVYNILEDLLIKFCGKEREGNLFCLSSSDAAHVIQLLCDIVAQQNWGGFRSQKFKYSSVNFASIPKFGSLEFRAMRGTRDIDVIKTWVSMLLKVKDYSLQFNQPNDLIEQLSARGGNQFVKDVLEEYASLIKHPNTDQIIRDGVWRVQELAYIPIPDKKKPAMNRYNPKKAELEAMMANLQAGPLVIPEELEGENAEAEEGRLQQPRRGRVPINPDMMARWAPEDIQWDAADDMAPPQNPED